MSRDIDRIRQYITNKHNGQRLFTDQDDIIQNRLIDSLQFVEFILFIEEVSGIAINMESLDIENFRSIDNIKQAFFA
jgi:acyl carrier protein